MKYTVIALLSAAVATAAQPHNHHVHQQLHEKRGGEHGGSPSQQWGGPEAVHDVVVAGPTVVVYELNGKLISETDVLAGIKNGTLVYASNGQLSSAQAPVAPSTSAAAPPPAAQPTEAQHHQQGPPQPPPSSSSSSSPPPPPPSSSSTPAPAPSSQAPPPPSSSAAPAPSSQPAPQQKGPAPSSNSGGSGVDRDFPDGEIDCSHFPSDYGAVAIDWLGIGGWAGVQSPGAGGLLKGFADIFTATKSTCSGGKCCSEGSFCSYACPAGYQKSQWPSTQGATGQSVGGLQCKNGKLHLTNTDLSSKLCVTGAAQVSILVENKLGKNVAVCRTDYPGTEGMTIPVDVQAGASSNLTCPDSSAYYHWQGGSTSAQYYVNPAGVSVDDACQWGSSANPWGNFAPLNLGVGYSNGAAWLSVFQNAPTTNAKLDFSVEIKGDGISGTCKYSNGQYCGGANYDACSPTTGCTVSLKSGTATFVFS